MYLYSGKNRQISSRSLLQNFPRSMFLPMKIPKMRMKCALQSCCPVYRLYFHFQMNFLNSTQTYSFGILPPLEDLTLCCNLPRLHLLRFPYQRGLPQISFRAAPGFAVRFRRYESFPISLWTCSRLCAFPKIPFFFCVRIAAPAGMRFVPCFSVHI